MRPDNEVILFLAAVYHSRLLILQALAHPSTGPEPLDAGAFSADSRAHRATRGASDV